MTTQAAAPGAHGETAPGQVLDDHALYVLFPIRCREGVSVEVGRPISALGPAVLNATAEPKGSRAWIPQPFGQILDDRPIWEAATLDTSTDLHPHVRRLLGADLPGGETGGAVFGLSQQAQKLINGKPYRAGAEGALARSEPYALELVLSAAAGQRLAAQGADLPSLALDVSIDGLRVIHFRTGHAIAFGELTFGVPGASGAKAPLPSACLVEAANELSHHFNRLRWRREAATSATFAITDVLCSLLGVAPEAAVRARLYTYAFAATATALSDEASGRLATQLCRHYTDDYQIKGTVPGATLVRPFSNITHGFGIEGGATILGDCRATSFLAAYRSNTIRSNYLPIVLLSFHEFNVLLALSQDSGFWPDYRVIGKQQLAALERLKRDILSFRLFYRVSFVSLTGPHNLVHAALREAFQTDRTLQEVTADVVEVHAFLRERRTSQREHKYRLPALIGVFGVSFLTINTIAKEILGTVFGKAEPGGHAAVQRLLDWIPPHLVSPVAFCIATVTALVAVYLSYSKMLDMVIEPEESLTDQATHEAILHRARET